MVIDRRTFIAGALALPSFPAPAGAQPTGPLVLEARPGESGRLAYAGDGYDGILRLRKGAELAVRLINRLDRPTSIHWRGVRGPNAMDGVAPLVQRPVPPSESFDYRFTPPDSGLFMFHAHAEPDFAAQTARGLAGLLIVEDPADPPVDREIVAAIAEAWDERPCGAFTLGEIAGAPGAEAAITINGAAAPIVHTAAPRGRVRLRLANVTTGRLLPLVIEGAQAYIIAVDGQPCAPFEPLRNIVPSAPGSRFDLIVDMPPQAGARIRVAVAGGDAPAPDLITLVAEGAPVAPRPPVAAAPANPLLPETIPLQKARRMDLVLDVLAPPDAAACADAPVTSWRINGKPAGTGPLFSVRRGTPVSLGFINKSNAHVAMRVHGHVVRQLHLLDDGWDPYWRDAVVVPAGRTVRVAFVADNPGKWRIGAGVLAHAAGGLATFFDVT